jgi:hypothetical protein
MVSENSMLRRIYEPKREEMAGGWRRLHNELHNLYTSPNIIRMIKLKSMRWSGHVTCMGEMRNAYIILVGKLERKRPFRRSRHRWEDIRMDVREIG